MAAPRPHRVLLHVSEDQTITRFVPHVPRTNPTHPSAVWAIDVEHAPLYWFPRDCPRVTAWPRGPDEASAFRAAFRTTAPRVHGIVLRLVPSLWPLHDLAVSDRWDFSIVRMANARPRSPDGSDPDAP